jgi:hypothetical protein
MYLFIKNNFFFFKKKKKPSHAIIVQKGCFAALNSCKIYHIKQIKCTKILNNLIYLIFSSLSPSLLLWFFTENLHHLFSFSPTFFSFFFSQKFAALLLFLSHFLLFFLLWVTLVVGLHTHESSFLQLAALSDGSF